jgi:hypothetical protein
MPESLSMLECSTCGTCLGDKYKYLQQFVPLLQKMRDENINAGFEGFEGFEVFKYGDGLTLAPFLTTYYTWLSTHIDQDIYEPSNVIARGLLRIRELLPEHLPFGRLNRDGQRNQFEASICCLRMLHCDPN